MSDTLQDFVSSQIHMTSPEEDVLSIFNVMKRYKIRHLPVVEKGQAVGIISDRDLQFVNVTGDSFKLKAKDIMTEAPYSVDTQTSIAHVVNTMNQKKINSVLIHDQKGKVTGIFTSTDALKILSDIYKESAEPESAEPEKP